MNIAIVGYSKEGRSAFAYWNQPGNTITICDQNTIQDLPEGVGTNFGGDYLQDLQNFDLIVRTPGLHPNAILEANPDHPEIKDKITTVTNEFFKVCPAPIIGVTGTKGKGTTSTLIAKILETAGHKVHLGGNIGTPALELLQNTIQPTDTVVLELSSFQLIDLQYSPKIGVCLMIAPEHLNWHSDMYEYIHAKQQLFANQKRDNLAVYNARNDYSEEIAGVSQAYKVAYDVPPIGEEALETRGVYLDGNHIRAYGHEVCNIKDIALLGRHNIENVCAAIAATWDLAKHDKAVIKKVVSAFGGLPHRLEIVKQVDGIWYINDSFASNPEATVAAIDAVTKPKVLIVGGVDRNIPLGNLVQKIKQAAGIKKVVIIGEVGPKIAQALQGADYNNFVVHQTKAMPDIINAARQHAVKGDAIVLSPGFASFDMFKDFEDRGLQFKKVVSNL